MRTSIDGPRETSYAPLRHIQQTLRACAKKIQPYQLEQLKLGRYEVEQKFEGNGSSDIVTSTDRGSEEMIREIVGRELPDYLVFGEEYGADKGDASRLVICDPIDGTTSFTQGRPGFGPILAAYHDGRCVAGLEGNTMLGITASATQDDPFELEGPVELAPQIPYRCSGTLPGKISASKQLGPLIARALDVEPVLETTHYQDVLFRSYVFAGRMRGFVHTGLAWHDIAAAPLFGAKTGVLVTDHRGVPYDRFDVERERERYAIGTKAAVYCHTAVIARPDDHSRILEAIAPYADALDQIARGER